MSTIEATESIAHSQGHSMLPMRRLPFTLHDFTRMSWVSNAAKELWEPRIRRISQAWLEIEWLAIGAGVRPCCITVVTPAQFMERAPQWASCGLNALPIAMVASPSTYSSTFTPPEAGKPFAFRMVLGSPEDVSEFKLAWDNSDDVAMGRKLGYPSCCLEFFKRVWIDDGLVDTTWPMAAATARPDPAATIAEYSSPPKSNILWRWMGVRAVPHLPCHAACEPTQELADRFIEVGRQNGFDQEIDWMLEVLDWPVEWSALHGIAEIKTPIMKVSTRTDATPCKYTVRYKGRRMPEESARGLRFPFSVLSLPILTESRGFKRGLENPITLQPTSFSWYASDNGFSATADMDRAHQSILTVANRVLDGQSGSILDLGCGNGALLKKLHEANPAVVPFGVDMDGSRIAHAGELLPRFAKNFFVGDVLGEDAVWPEGRKYAMALIMPGRLLEGSAERADQLRARLRDHCDQILVYAYGDWLVRYGTLEDLAAAAGFDIVDWDNSSNAAIAMLR